MKGVEVLLAEGKKSRALVDLRGRLKQLAENQEILDSSISSEELIEGKQPTEVLRTNLEQLEHALLTTSEEDAAQIQLALTLMRRGLTVMERCWS